jgi:anti-sigma28 factor (negative regulator of flagellin synthesis)
MEIPFIPNETIQRSDTQKANPVQATKAYGASGKKTADAGDAVQISSKSKLMQKLRTSYAELEKQDEAKVIETKQQLEKSTVEMSSEEIVTHILSGSLFDAV